MSIYRVHFKWKGKDVVLSAKSLDLTHPYFVSIKDLVFLPGSTVIINPSEDDLKRAFGDANHLMIPFQTVSLIEEMSEGERARLMPFSLLEKDSAVGSQSWEESAGPETDLATSGAEEPTGGDRES